MQPVIWYHVDSSSPLVPVLGTTSPVRTLVFNFFEIHSVIGFFLLLDLPGDVFLSGISTKLLFAFVVSHTCSMSHSDNSNSAALNIAKTKTAGRIFMFVFMLT
jgi:hypothetical protein